MMRILGVVTFGVVSALCLAMAGCTGPVDAKSNDLQRHTKLNATSAGAAEKQSGALEDGRSVAVADHPAESDHDEAVGLGAAYVTADRLNVRIAPSLDAEVTGVLYGGQRVEVLEVQEGWSRISRYYDEGTGAGSVRVARWVASAYLSNTWPDDDGVRVDAESPLGRAIDRSDDAHLYRSSFLTAARRLIERGQCTVSDFEDIGGWVWSPGRGESVYFTYCGGRYASNRIYLEAESGRIFRSDSPPASPQNY